MYNKYWIYIYTMYNCPFTILSYMKKWWKDSYHFGEGPLRCLLASRRWKPQSQQTSCSDIEGHLVIWAFIFVTVYLHEELNGEHAKQCKCEEEDDLGPWHLISQRKFFRLPEQISIPWNIKRADFRLLEIRNSQLEANCDNASFCLTSLNFPVHLNIIIRSLYNQCKCHPDY